MQEASKRANSLTTMKFVCQQCHQLMQEEHVAMPDINFKSTNLWEPLLDRAKVRRQLDFCLHAKCV